MDDLHQRFGRLLAMHRRQRGLTQQELAERADLSVDMISKMEVGATGARFPSILKLSKALQVDPADFFVFSGERIDMLSGPLSEITMRLAKLPENELVWVKAIIDAALRPR